MLTAFTAGLLLITVSEVRIRSRLSSLCSKPTTSLMMGWWGLTRGNYSIVLLTKAAAAAHHPQFLTAAPLAARLLPLVRPVMWCSGCSDRCETGDTTRGRLMASLDR